MTMEERTTTLLITAVRLRNYLARWKWIIAGVYGMILILIMTNIGKPMIRNEQLNGVIESLDSRTVKRETSGTAEKRNLTRKEKDILLVEEYKNYVKTHNITVTMFTTFADREESRYIIQNNTVLNWLHLQNVNFKLILFGNRQEIADYQLQHVKSFKKRIKSLQTDAHWRREPSYLTSNELYESKSYSKNNSYYQTWDFIPLEKHLTAHGRPILKQMYLEVQRRYNSDLYMYVNGDILFHARSFLHTLYGIKQFVDDRKTKTKKWLIFGGRREVSFYDQKKKMTRELQYGHDAEITNVSRNSRVMNQNALDFFICSKTSFQWALVPNFVVSLPLFDHWLVLYSNKVGIETFDITNTARVVHQKGVQKLKDSIYEKADDLNRFIFDTSLGIRCAFDTSMARLHCMRKATKIRRVGKEDVIVVTKNHKFDTPANNSCIFPYPLTAPILDPISDEY
ncbi:unnamed protein product [Owenia fusiformis]|uniref:Uncharacterized protein n=1 Tax=Owenia fusiformis TaxID=6347 RepID=A0A8J1Y9B0_OWEFU|nr:unnamed protein product [Owenia fusiformis]